MVEDDIRVELQAPPVHGIPSSNFSCSVTLLTDTEIQCKPHENEQIKQYFTKVNVSLVVRAKSIIR